MKVPKFEQKPCYYCGKMIKTRDDQSIEDVPVTKDTKVVMFPKYFHKDCVTEYFSKIEQENHNLEHSKEESETHEWDKVYNYFKHDILNMDTGNLSPYTVMRLRGLYTGKFMPKNENTLYRKNGYPYEVILMTLKLIKHKLVYALTTVDFSDDQHKINYLMKIVTENINFCYDIYMKREKAKKLSEKNSVDYEKEQHYYQDNAVEDDDLSVAEQKAKQWMADKENRKKENEFML